MNKKLTDVINSEISNDLFREELENVLIDILEIDTSPAQGILKLKEAESLCFKRISDYINKFISLNGKLVMHDINKNIDEHKFYTRIVSAAGVGEIPAVDVYNGRYNMLYLCGSAADGNGRNIGLNAHIDVVNPYFPPERAGLYIRGRGSVDDKGGIAVILGALKIINVLADNGVVELNKNIAAMFVIDEEIGGNGSLSVAMDRELKEKYYDSLLILECAGNKIFPGGRGAVFIKIDGKTKKNGLSKEETSLILETIVSGIYNIIQEGLKIKKESYHELFPQNPVYTCTGIIDRFGKHPSGICDFVEFTVTGNSADDMVAVRKAVSSGVEKYIRIFGDKSSMIDPLSGTAKVKQHYSIETVTSECLKIAVYGSGGHMGSLPENDAAITKWVYIVKELIKIKYAVKMKLNIGLSDSENGNGIVFEGAQSFLPCHKMDDIINRLENVFFKGVEKFRIESEEEIPEVEWDISFNKLHNEAFAIASESGSVMNARDAGVESGIINKEEELVGWEASCDARIFALEYDELPVITTGPGALNGAHSSKESLYLPDLYKSILFTTLFILKETKSKVNV